MPKNSWARSAVVYQIYPMSFQDSNGDGKGDLQGIISRLDYLKDLGIGAIWLSPIFKSPMADFGYDISDYEDINPVFGNLKDFDNLVEEAHRREIKIMLDFVPNHTSSEHPWFVESASSRTNPKRNWYLWADPDTEGKEPNNWLSVFGGSGWEFDERTKQYYFHSFLNQQPDLNWRNPEVRERMNEVLEFWLRRGVDGFRMDAVYHMIKDDQLRDNPLNPSYAMGVTDPYLAQLNIYTHGLPETLVILKEFSETIAKFGDTFMITEVHVPLDQIVAMYLAVNPARHSPFNFSFIYMPWSVSEYKKFVDSFEKSMLPEYVPNYVLGNHDKPRVASRIGPQRARLMSMLEFTLRGMPFIYYGEEIGLEEAVIPPGLVQDQFEKNVPGMKLGRDGCRTPMQWDSSPHAGFTSGDSWLPVSDNYLTVNAHTESKTKTSMLALYKKLIQLRAGSSAMLEGNYESFEIHKEVFSFCRSLDNERYFVLLNFSEEKIQFIPPFREGHILVSTYMDKNNSSAMENAQVELRAYEGVVVKA